MLDTTTITDLYPLIGSSAFLPSLLTYVRNSSSGNLPLDPGIFQAILQCMVAGGKYLIIFTPEEDVSLVVKLAAWTLSSVFDLPTFKEKVKSRMPLPSRYKDPTPAQDPNLFLRSLFLHINRNDGGELSKSTSHSKPRTSRRRPSFMRPASAPNDSHHSSKLSTGTSHQTSASDDVPDSAPPLIIAAPQPRLAHANTDPLPLLQRREILQPEVPHALVVHGLEHASVADQKALAQALHRRQFSLEPHQNETSAIHSHRRSSSRNHNDHHHSRTTGVTFEDTDWQGTWNLPDDFILVSVCPWSARERPKIHRSLLDLFSMSSTIYVQKHVRDAWKALPFISRTPSHSRVHSANSNPATPSPLQSTPLQSPRTPPALSQALPTLLRHRSSRAHLGQPAPFVPKQLIPRDFILYLQKLAQNAYVSSQLSLYMSDLFSAIRHHPKLDGTFLTAKCMNDAQDLARAGRVIGTDPTGGELLRYYPPVEYDKDNEEDGYLENRRTSEEIHEYIGSGSESVTINIQREPTPSTSRATKDYEVPSISVSGSEEDVIKSMFLSEAAIARVVPRAVTHRLRVRDPWDEVLAGAVFGATFEPQKKESGDGEEYYWDTKSTVKDILVEILSEV